MPDDSSVEGTGADEVRQATGQVRRTFDWPDILSISRLPLAFFFVILHASPVARVTIVFTAAFTDIVDGLWARRRGSSVVGPVIDGVFDKLFFLVAFATLLLEGLLSPLQAALVMTRDIVAFGGLIVVSLAGAARAIPARAGGKLVTAAQIATLTLAIFDSPAVTTLVWVTFAVSVYAIVDYAKTDRSDRRSSSDDSNPRGGPGVHSA